jgi:hypothetical protein
LTFFFDGDACWKIESKPRDGQRSQYTASLLWIRKNNYSYAAIENYKEGKLIRRVKYKDMEDVQGIWTARLLDMEDLTRKSRSILKLDSLKYNVFASRRRFHPASPPAGLSGTGRFF